MRGDHVIEVWTAEQVREAAQAIPNPKVVYCLLGLFATGARVNEFLELRKKDLTFQTVAGVPPEPDRTFLRVQLRTFKNRRTPARSVFIDTVGEAWLVEPFNKQLALTVSDDARLFEHSDRWVERKLKHYCGKHPHFFRHSRITNWYVAHKLRDSIVQRLAGWSDTQMANTYVHLRDADVLDAIMKSESK